MGKQDPRISKYYSFRSKEIIFLSSFVFSENFQYFDVFDFLSYNFKFVFYFPKKNQQSNPLRLNIEIFSKIFKKFLNVMPIKFSFWFSKVFFLNQPRLVNDGSPQTQSRQQDDEPSSNLSI